jgi:hypothetical protein
VAERGCKRKVRAAEAISKQVPVCIMTRHDGAATLLLSAQSVCALTGPMCRSMLLSACVYAWQVLLYGASARWALVAGMPS